MLEKLKKINNLIIDNNHDNEKILTKHLIIKEILEDKNCFLKMDIEYAYSILRDLQIKEEDLKSVYCELIDINLY